MKIILGVFGDSFDTLRDKYNAIEYGFCGWINNYDYHPKCPYESMVVNEVCYNLDVCTSCIFDVTRLRLPFNAKVTTLKELHVVMNNEEYFNKTTFFVNSKPVDKNKLKELFFINEPIEFKAYSELFDSSI